jgi:DNA-binding transcriptional LysR family regulator
VAGERMILREPGSTTRKALEEALTAQRIKPRIVLEIGSREAIREAVAKGLGISAVSEAEYVEHPDLRALRIADAEVYTYAHVLCLQERRRARVVKAFMDIVDELVAITPARGAAAQGDGLRRR